MNKRTWVPSDALSALRAEAVFIEALLLLPLQMMCLPQQKLFLASRPQRPAGKAGSNALLGAAFWEARREGVWLVQVVGGPSPESHKDQNLFRPGVEVRGAQMSPK